MAELRNRTEACETLCSILRNQLDAQRNVLTEANAAIQEISSVSTGEAPLRDK
ncbi:MAG: hypothetical protein ABSG59_24800 [Verrucomicrobiota bacterium]|jgi:hypothetical protein